MTNSLDHLDPADLPTVLDLVVDFILDGDPSRLPPAFVSQLVRSTQSNPDGVADALLEVLHDQFPAPE